MKDLAKGMVLVAMTGTIAYAVYLTKSGTPLWALLLVLWTAGTLFDKDIQGF